MLIQFERFLGFYSAKELKSILKKTTGNVSSKLLKNELIDQLQKDDRKRVLKKFLKKQLETGLKKLNKRTSGINKAKLIENVLECTRYSIYEQNEKIKYLLLNHCKREERFLQFESKIAILFNLTLHWNHNTKIPIAGIYIRSHYNETLEIIVVLRGQMSLNKKEPFIKERDFVTSFTEMIKKDPIVIFMPIYEHLLKLQSKQSNDSEKTEIEKIIRDYTKRIKKGKETRENLDIKIVLISGKREDYQKTKESFEKIPKADQERLKLHKKHTILDIRSYTYLYEQQVSSTEIAREYCVYDDILWDEKNSHTQLPSGLLPENRKNRSKESDSRSHQFDLDYTCLPHFFSHYEYRSTATTIDEQFHTLLDLIQNGLKFIGTILLCDSISSCYSFEVSNSITSYKKLHVTKDKNIEDVFKEFVFKDSFGTNIVYIQKILQYHHSDRKSYICSQFKNGKINYYEQFQKITNQRNKFSHQGHSTFDKPEFLDVASRLFPIFQELMSYLYKYQMGIFKEIPTHMKTENDEEYNSYYWFASVGKEIYTPPVILKFKKHSKVPIQVPILLSIDLIGFLSLEPFIYYDKGQYYWLTNIDNKKQATYENVINRGDKISKIQKGYDISILEKEKPKWTELYEINHWSNQLFKELDYFHILDWILFSTDRKESKNSSYINVKYLGKAGKNGSSVVFEALKKTEKGENKVALKFSDVKNRKKTMFFGEQGKLEELKDIKGLPTVLGSDSAPIGTHLYYYFEMDFVEGIPIEKYLDEKGDIQRKDFIQSYLKEIIEQVLEILEQLLERHVIHGYIDFQNILFDKNKNDVHLVDLSMVEKCTDENKCNDIDKLIEDIENMKNLTSEEQSSLDVIIEIAKSFKESL